MRFGTELRFEEIIKKIKSKTDNDWEYKEVLRSEGYYITKDNELRKVLEKNYKYVMGEDAEMGGILFTGGTHARYLKDTVPVTNSNKIMTPSYEMPKGHGGYHQPDEKLHVESFIDSIKILVFLIMGVDEMLDKTRRVTRNNG